MSDPGILFSLAVSLAGISFSIGVWFGISGRDRLWRGKAESGFRMASGGRLYNVTEDRAQQQKAQP